MSTNYQRVYIRVYFTNICVYKNNIRVYPNNIRVYSNNIRVCYHANDMNGHSYYLEFRGETIYDQVYK